MIVGADHRLGDAVLVGGVAEGEAALDAGMAFVGLARLVGDHAHDRFALHLGLERAADAAIGAGGDDRAVGLAERDDAFLVQRRGRAGLHAGAAGDAFRAEESRPRRAKRAKQIRGRRMVSANVPCTSSQARTQREQTMHLEDSKVKYGIGVVGRRLHVVGAVIAVAHLAQADDARLGLQLAIAVGRAGEAIERVIGDVELHHAAPEFCQPRRLRAHHHAVFGRRRAGGGRALAAFDLDEAQPARAEGFERVGGAELWDRLPGQRGGAP